MTNWKQFLTEKVIHEIWHEPKITAGRCGCSCGQNYYLSSSYNCQNRTFDNRNDLMDIYVEIKKAGKWDNFLVFLWPIYLDESKHLLNTNARTARGVFVAWIFCLGNEDYESRCKMVVEFYRWE